MAFVTLGLSAVISLIAINYFERSNRVLFQHVEKTAESILRTNELNRMLVSLELDIRELINVVLKEPYRLADAKEELQAQFDLINLKAGEGEKDAPRRKLLQQLKRYRTSLDRLLRDYGAINSGLYEVYYSINNFTEQFAYMEKAAGRLMIEQALKGRNTDALQQAYVLITLARENVLQVHIMVNSSIGNSKTDLLGFPALTNKGGPNHEATVVNKIISLNNALQTLTAADDSISYHADNILAALPVFREDIEELARTLTRHNIDLADFRDERDTTLQLLDEVNNNNKDRIRSIEETLHAHGKRNRLLSWLISLVVLVVAIYGLRTTKRMGRQIESTAADAVSAKEKVEALNDRLQREIVERQRAAEDLQQARDELELRVRERTKQLSSSNRSLAFEIEERRNAEYALAAEKERLTVTLRSIGDGVITTDMNGTVVLLNKVAEEMTGWSLAEARGRPLTEIFHIVHKKSGDICASPVEIMRQSGILSKMSDDTVLIERGGEKRDISDSCAPIRDKDSNVVGAVLVFRNVTERKKMEEEALKAEKLKSVGVLAGGIAHDFNNILAAILGNISLAKLHIDQGETENIRRLLEDAEKASLRARNLTQQLLTFSKGGEPILKVESIAEIIRESADFILSGGKVNCQYTIAEDLWPVNIDTGQMSQVIQNIIINAMHAMPEGGTIEISCSNYVNDRQHLLSLPEGNYIRIDIRDSGDGIPADLMDKIFDPYFTTKEEGSGLGLALTHSIVNKHQGHIEVDSGDWGTCFSIFLPAMPDYTFIPETIGRDVPLETERAKILVMDDEPMVRDIARDMLLHLGFEVLTAASGREAVEIYEQNRAEGDPIDIVIMDLTIPGGMGGKEAISKLLAIDPGVKAIVSSGYSNDPVMSEYRKFGFAGMVNKPFQLTELQEAVTRVLHA